jgi:hypothetical protein
VNQFQMDNSRWPGEDEGLTVLVQRPMDARTGRRAGTLDTTDLPKDGWNRDFIFELFPRAANRS